MSNLNTVIKAILHASSEPMSGYDIAKKISKKSGNSHQQIYRELGKIAQLPNVTVVNVPQDGKPDKKMYSISGPAPDVNFASSDFTKTAFGYSLLAQDVVSGTNNFNSYVVSLEWVEDSILQRLTYGAENKSKADELHEHLRECVDSDSEAFIGVTEEGVKFNYFEWSFGLSVQARREHEQQAQKVEQLQDALSGVLDAYCDLVNSGDAGNWDPEADKEVIAARKALEGL